MLRRIDAQAEALQTLSFPVLGLPSSHRAPVALTGSSGSNGRIESVDLTFGDRAEPTGPVVVVRTRRADAAAVPPASTPEPLSPAARGEQVESSTGRRLLPASSKPTALGRFVRPRRSTELRWLFTSKDVPCRLEQ